MGGIAGHDTFGRIFARLSISVGPDGNEHLLWDNVDGTAAFWRAAPQSQFLDQQHYGRF